MLSQKFFRRASGGILGGGRACGPYSSYCFLAESQPKMGVHKHVQYCIVGNFEGEKFRELMKSMTFAEKTFADCWLLPCQRTPHPKFYGENVHEQPQDCKIRKRFLPRNFPTKRTVESGYHQAHIVIQCTPLIKCNLSRPLIRTALL